MQSCSYAPSSGRSIITVSILSSSCRPIIAPDLAAKIPSTVRQRYLNSIVDECLKIYPTLVIRGTGLYELWKTGRYRSYPPSALVDLVARVLALVPPWTRVYRVQRDIPMPLVS